MECRPFSQAFQPPSSTAAASCPSHRSIHHSRAAYGPPLASYATTCFVSSIPSSLRRRAKLCGDTINPGALSIINRLGPGAAVRQSVSVRYRGQAHHLDVPVVDGLSSAAALDNKPLLISRTGYTGEPLGFELFVDSAEVESLWNRLTELGAQPAGLGARDSLRTEAGLPLYGNELGLDPGGTKEIPIFALSQARFAVSFHPDKGTFIGQEALQEQFSDRQKIKERDFEGVRSLKQIIQPIALVGKGIARHGDKVFLGDKQVGWITSGTVAPYWKTTGEGLESRMTDETGKRPVCLGLIDSTLQIGQELDIDVRGKRIKAAIVERHR